MEGDVLISSFENYESLIEQGESMKTDRIVIGAKKPLPRRQD